MKIIPGILTGIILGLQLLYIPAVDAGTKEPHPGITATVPFFYYHDLRKAADWYENKLGLVRSVDEKWVVFFTLNGGSRLGLVNASGGSLKPAKDKGVMLSLETEQLEEWYDRLKDDEGVSMIHGIRISSGGMIEEFQIIDPGGYIVEFFRWRGAHASKYSSQGKQTVFRGRKLISSGSKWEKMAAYSRAVVEDDWVFVSGTVGFNPKDKAIPESFDLQMDYIFQNITRALTQANSSLADIVRVRSFLTDKKYVAAMSQKLRQYLGDVLPTNTTIIVELAAEGAKVEIEVTAHKRMP
ncbi:MAG: hypothetical protein COB49_01045 [Alphaproteobacteria bacterium]|nr:MAG: hypothetical protein COB49_01045 [Alphaproteobacteria bacterium]